MHPRDPRRSFLSAAGAGILLVGCRAAARSGPPPAAPNGAAGAVGATAGQPANEQRGEDVSATEDLMREHGVIRRVLVVFRVSATRLRTHSGSVPPDALQRAGKLMRRFGEEYHEKQLEEANIFPQLAKGNPSLVNTVQTLTAQHQRGREITDYLLAVSQRAIAAEHAEPLARSLEAFARMYEEHAAIEDTIVFPAWKKVLTPEELHAMGDRFEDIEHKTFGKDGFDDAVDQIGAIEKALGIDLAEMTAPPPPKA